MTSRSDDGASPMVGMSMSRKQAEMLLALVQAQPQRKWDPVLRNMLDGLRRNAGSREYQVDAKPQEPIRCYACDALAFNRALVGQPHERCPKDGVWEEQTPRPRATAVLEVAR